MLELPSRSDFEALDWTPFSEFRLCKGLGHSWNSNLTRSCLSRRKEWRSEFGVQWNPAKGAWTFPMENFTAVLLALGQSAPNVEIAPPTPEFYRLVSAGLSG